MKKKLTALLLFLSVITLMFSSCNLPGTAPSEKSDVFYLYFDTVCTVSDYSGLSDEEFDVLSALVEGELEKTRLSILSYTIFTPS